MTSDELCRRRANIEALLHALATADELAAGVFDAAAAIPPETWSQIRQMQHAAICFEAANLIATVNAMVEAVGMTQH